MKHIVLLGDSIFDNRAYTGSEPDVVTHLRAIIPDDWRATLCAVDGNLAEHVAGQLKNAPADATHLVVSAGGNNAIMNADILGLKTDSAAAVFDVLANRAGDFELHYRIMLDAVAGRNLPAAVCTVYFPNFPDAAMQKIATAALAAFNDVIIRLAVGRGLPVIDLRLVCDEPDDYANEIEPSGKGGRKIAAKIFEVVKDHDFSKNRTSFYY
ncbi:MAG: SGNH/GDSL hydrolase family protein [Acidobacteria bacterium]|nr:SGNH/GDSL hydrolase family protein [Acidobacteriota bacterium]